METITSILKENKPNFKGENNFNTQRKQTIFQRRQ